MKSIKFQSSSKEGKRKELEELSPAAKRGMELFRKGYNCCQSTFGAFYEDLGLDINTAMRMASSFGGGMGRLREVCGALSGIFLAWGLYCGYSDPGADDEKAVQYSRVQELAAVFKETNGSLICRELLDLPIQGADAPIPSKRTEEYYTVRPCELFVGSACALLESFLKENSIT